MDYDIGGIINGQWELLLTYYQQRSGRNRLIYEVRCTECGYVDAQAKETILNRKKCKNCKDLEDRSMLGNMFYRLIPLEILENERSYNGKLMVKCLCMCGNVFNCALADIKSGRTKSCGCLQKEKPWNYTHRLSHTQLYNHWKNMNARCSDMKNMDYGGRGIRVCPEWQGEEGLRNFYNWAVNNSNYIEGAGLELGRIDSNGDYCPENCRWETREEQMYNTSRTVYVNIDGIDYTIKDLSELYDLDKNKLSNKFQSNQIERYVKETFNEKMNLLSFNIHMANYNEDYYNKKCKIDKENTNGI